MKSTPSTCLHAFKLTLRNIDYDGDMKEEAVKCQIRKYQCQLVYWCKDNIVIRTMLLQGRYCYKDNVVTRTMMLLKKCCNEDHVVLRTILLQGPCCYENNVVTRRVLFVQSLRIKSVQFKGCIVIHFALKNK